MNSAARPGRFLRSGLLAPLFAALLAGCVGTYADVVAARRDIDRMEERALARLYRAREGSKRQVDAAVGHAAFGNIDVDLLLFGGGAGSGVVVDHATGRRTYMRMVRASLGLGLGVRNYCAVFVFWTDSALREFVESGLALGAEAEFSAALSAGFGLEHAMAVTVRQGVSVFQLTERGLSLRADLNGTKYWCDPWLTDPASAAR